MCVDCLICDMINRPHKYLYFVKARQVENSLAWFVATIHEAVTFACLVFLRSKERVHYGHPTWYDVESVVSDMHRTYMEDQTYGHTCGKCKPYRDDLHKMRTGLIKDRKLMRYPYFTGEGRGFVTIDDIRYAVECMLVNTSSDLEVPDANKVKSEVPSGHLTEPSHTIRDFGDKGVPAHLLVSAPWHFMGRDVVDKRILQSTMDVLHDIYLERGMSEDFDACKEIFECRVQRYLNIQWTMTLNTNPWVGTYLRTLEK